MEEVATIKIEPEDQKQAGCDPPWDFTKPNDFLDTAFEVEGQVLYGNKSVLCMWSPVLRQMLHGNHFKESTMDKIRLEKKYRAMVMFMGVVHPPCEPITKHSVFEILPIVHEYQIDKLVEQCRIILTEMQKDKKCDLRIMCYAERYNFEQLEKECLKKAKITQLSKLESQQAYDEIGKDNLMKILHYQAGRLEHHVNEGICTWASIIERPSGRVPNK